MYIRQGDYCLDTLGHHRVGEKIGVYQCHGTGGNQEWIWNEKHKELRHGVAKLCIDKANDATIHLISCTAKGSWSLSNNDGLLKKGDTHCLALIPSTQQVDRVLAMIPCDANDHNQKWTFIQSSTIP
jgi:polypeptide N-acetylgalactosaminyltransferase